MIFSMNAAGPHSPDASRPGVRHLTIDAGHAGQRLDNFLLYTLKGVPRTRIYRLLRKGEVRVNKGRAGPDYRLEEGDVVRIPPVRQGESTGKQLAAQAAASGRFDWLHDRVLMEDEHLLVLDKPAWRCTAAAASVSG